MTKSLSRKEHSESTDQKPETLEDEEDPEDGSDNSAPTSEEEPELAAETHRGAGRAPHAAKEAQKKEQVSARYKEQSKDKLEPTPEEKVSKGNKSARSGSKVKKVKSARKEKHDLRS